jgi:hypothetical protein
MSTEEMVVRISEVRRRRMWKDLPMRQSGQWLYVLQKDRVQLLSGMDSWRYTVLRYSKAMRLHGLRK